MSTESQNQKVKLCFSCKRQLPLNFFGVRMLSPDGYNPCCKECRNFRRRQAYQQPNSIDEPILPLNEHNTRFLWALPESSRVESLVGIDLTNLKPVLVTFKVKSKNSFFLNVNFLVPGKTIEHGLIHTGDKTGFIDFATIWLGRAQIRLFHSKDLIALTNWGLNLVDLSTLASNSNSSS